MMTESLAKRHRVQVTLSKDVYDKLLVGAQKMWPGDSNQVAWYLRYLARNEANRLHDEQRDANLEAHREEQEK